MKLCLNIRWEFGLISGKWRTASSRFKKKIIRIDTYAILDKAISRKMVVVCDIWNKRNYLIAISIGLFQCLHWCRTWASGTICNNTPLFPGEIFTSFILSVRNTYIKKMEKSRFFKRIKPSQFCVYAKFAWGFSGVFSKRFKCGIISGLLMGFVLIKKNGGCQSRSGMI